MRTYKKELLATVCTLFAASFVYGQSLKYSLYNTGNMSVKGIDNNATLYIEGDLITDNQPSTPGCNIMMGQGKIVLTGNLRHNAYTSASRSGYTQAFSRATPGGKLEFRGGTKQEIYSDSVRLSSVPFIHRPLKSTDYIYFPDSVEINNKYTVVMDPRMAGEMRNIVMTKGVFVLDSRFPDAGDYPTSTIPILPSAPYNTMIAHLKITGNVKYPYYESPPATINDYDEIGRFQVNLSVNPADGSDDLTSSFGSPYKRMYGMASPYESIRSDYFMFNTLTLPDPVGFLGTQNQTERSPEVQLNAGRGFFVGIDLRGTDENEYDNLIDEKYSQILFADRAIDGYAFNRFKYMGNSNNIYPTYDGDNIPVYQAEKPVTGDITVNLETGYNYLGNSFLAPLSVKDLVEATGNVPTWHVSSGDQDVTNRQVMNRVWVSNPNTRAYEAGPFINYYHTYYTIKPTGGTYTGSDISDGDEFLIPPLQLFRVYAYSAGPITIPRDNVTHGSNMFLRSGGDERYDDFVFEVVDSVSETSDRVCVVLREPGELRSTSGSSGEDRLSFKSEAVQIVENGMLRLSSGSLPEQSAMSLLYLKNENGNAVDEKQLATTVSHEDLYMTPSWIPQTIYIRGLRLNTMRNIREIWLEDKKYETKTLMTPESYYRTTTEPTDADDRFRLWFVNEPSSLKEPEITPVNNQWDVFYDSTQRMLVAGTFTDADFGSIISVYDVQGQLYCREKVSEYVMNVRQDLPSGVYVVKITGNKNSYVTKLWIK
ncbi:MAG: T9SS type A sorting domain-containing protein [Candidatus Azobacteroides sp.]|nr:T9SS type A sorting domain-containing protein [Candidatus Azobacteroides sp.]